MAYRGYQPPRRSGNGRTVAIIAACALATFVVVYALASHGTAAPAAPAATYTPAATSAAQASADACDARPDASGDIYVRMLSPGTGWEAQRLGGEWRWDYMTGKCLTSVQLTIATAPTVAGSCTQVGYVKDNPGYDENATPARPLRVLAAQAGPAC